MKNKEINVANIQNSKRKRNFKIPVILITLFVIVVITSAYLSSVFSNSEDIEAILNGNSINEMHLNTVIYDKDGNKIDEIYGLENRIKVKYVNIPENLKNAIISIEDERFFEHNGVDIKRTLGAILTYLTNNGDSSYGGSTITQQLVKNITNDDKRDVKRKIREWYRAYDLEKRYSKEFIFETYANTIYFGEGAYGIEVAAKTYFDKSVKELTLAECATIAAAIQSPESTNPYTSEETKNALLLRKNLVLDKMLELGKITEAQYSLAKEEKLEFKRGNIGSKVKSYFVESVINQVIEDLQKEKDISYEEAKKRLYTGGYKIYTTLDQNVQNAIDKAYDNSKLFYKDKNGDFMQSAMVVIEQSSGQVVGIRGGADKKEANFVLNRATQSHRQPGSCMKPLGAYGPAFEKQKLTPSSILQDSPLTIGSWSPKNYYGYFRGNVSVRQAMALSMNLPAIRANMTVDVEFAYNFAKSCGLKSLVDSDRNIAPLSLGGLTNGVTPLEMASAYATIANGGDYNRPIFYTKVLDKNDKEELYTNYTPTRAMQKSTAAMLTTCLLDVTGYGTGAGSIQVGNMPVAGKTGNTDDDKDQWFCGFTPYYTIACWNGYDVPKPIGYRSYGSYPYTSMILFNNVMNDICKNKEVKQFDTSSSLEEVNICTVSQSLATTACYNHGTVTRKVVSSSSKPTSYCNMHFIVEENNNQEESNENEE